MKAIPTSQGTARYRSLANSAATKTFANASGNMLQTKYGIRGVISVSIFFFAANAGKRSTMSGSSQAASVHPTPAKTPRMAVPRNA